MKSGISLVEMAKEIQRQAELKADYVMDTRSLRLEPFGSDLYISMPIPRLARWLWSRWRSMPSPTGRSAPI